MSNEIQAPNALVYVPSNHSVFLAGSIEMGKAEKWQDKVVKALGHRPITFFNPRRDDWDSSWKQDISDPQFNKQVSWELKALESADYIVVYFDPTTQSPISLLELGLHAKGGKLIVCCPEGFWRKGNVDIVCKKYKVKQVQSLDEIVSTLDIMCSDIKKYN